MSSSRPDTAATNRDVDSRGNIKKFIVAKEATTYDNLLSDGSISNTDVRGGDGWSGLHRIPRIGINNKDVDTDILISYLLTCDPPADVNGITTRDGYTPMCDAAYHKITSAVKVLIDFGGDRTIKTNSYKPVFWSCFVESSIHTKAMKYRYVHKIRTCTGAYVPA